jgi:hypothetical protein
MSSPAELRALKAGSFARRVLRRPAKVIAAFERSFYVANRRGIACIGGVRLGSGPLNALVDTPFAIPGVGASVRVQLTGARTWLPPKAIRATQRVRAQVTISRGQFSNPHPAAEALRDWIARGAHGRAPSAIEPLIGLGPGLTPAGDDLVGGALVALRATRRHACAARVAAWAMRRSRRTNRISRAHLACAAAGEGGAALHAFINAVLAGKRSLARELAALDAIGHTSGWDAAAGALLVLTFPMSA